MSEQTTETGEHRLAHPFPSRREVHGSRIPSTTKTGTIPVVEDPKGEPDADVSEAAQPAGWHPVRPPEQEKPQEPKVQPKVEVQARAEETAPPAKPVAPKPDFPYPSRKVVHHTGQMPIVTQKQEEAAARKAGQARPTSPPDGVGRRPGIQGPRQSTKKKRRPSSLRTALVLILTLVFVGGAAYLAYDALKPPPSEAKEELDFPGPGEGTVEVTIAPGEIGTDIAQALVDAGVVKSVEGFRRAFDANSASSTIKPGKYTLMEGMTSAAALAALLDEGNRIDNAITVNPGQTVDQVAEKLVSVGGFTSDEVEGALKDTASFGLPEQAGGDVEGWLAAGSYELSAGSSPEQILGEMVERTTAELERLGVAKDEWETVLTKASILEREVANVEDMPKVARVIENRLGDKDGETAGLLQMDSTVLYGVGKYGGIPTTGDLESDSPYNTYMKAGLPPGPISTPSFAAIEATISPEEGDWLYFVTVNLDTGETKFSSSLDEQVANTEELKEWCAANPGRC